MEFEVTNHKSVPSARRTGLSAAIRSLELNQSINIPADGGSPARQRNRVNAIVQYCGGSEKYTMRMRDDKSFDVYRIS